MKILYTNLSPVTNSYANFNHLFLLKRYNPNKVIICIWDYFVYESPIFRKYRPKGITKEERLKQNIRNIEKILDYLKIDYKIILFSDAWNRLFNNPARHIEFQQILSKFSLKEINKYKIRYSQISNISLSKIHYIIADFLFAVNLPMIYPEFCNSIPSVYFTSERFKLFKDVILDTIRPSLNKNKIHRIEYVTTVPVIINKEGEMPGLENTSMIKNIFKDYLNTKITIKTLSEILEIFEPFSKSFLYNNKELDRFEFSEIIYKLPKQKKIYILSNLMKNYLKNISKILNSSYSNKTEKVKFISKINEFNNKIKILNGIKLLIIQQCNGNNTSLNIAKSLGLKLSTVSTYLTHLKKAGIITNSKKPDLIIEKVVMDIKNMEVKK